MTVKCRKKGGEWNITSQWFSSFHTKWPTVLMETFQRRCGRDDQLEQFQQVCCEQVGWARADGRSLASRGSFKL